MRKGRNSLVVAAGVACLLGAGTMASAGPYVGLRVTADSCTQATPTPVPTPAGSPTPTPSPTDSPTPSATPTPCPTTPTPAPTSSPSPTPQPSIKPSPVPSHVPVPTPTPVLQHKLTGLTPEQVSQELQTQGVIEQVREKLGGDIASALSAQDELTYSLDVNANQAKVIADRVAASRKRIAALDLKIKTLDGSIQDTQGRLDHERTTLRILARQLYEQPDSMLVQLAQATSVGQVLINYTDIFSAASRAQTLKQDLESSSSKLQSDRDAVASARAEEKKLGQTLTVNLAKLAVLQGQQQAEAAALNGRLSAFRTELQSVDKQSPELAQQITDVLEQEQDAIIAEAMQAVWNQVETLAASAIAETLPSSRHHSKKYRFIWPEPQAVITQPFGPTSLALEPAYMGYSHFHTGIDLAEPTGSPVLAADDGVVLLVGDSKVGGQQVGYGNFVVIFHSNGLTTLYGHLETALVKVGDAVKQGQPIGLEGSTGASTGPHCHFELRVNGQFVDPAPFLPPGNPSPSST